MHHFHLEVLFKNFKSMARQIVRKVKWLVNVYKGTFLDDKLYFE